MTCQFKCQNFLINALAFDMSIPYNKIKARETLLSLGQPPGLAAAC